MANPKTQSDSLKFKANLKVRSYQFSLAIIWFIGGFPQRKVYWIFADQLLRAATSIGANIIEAQCSSSRKEFMRYYEIALKSANGTRYWLSLLNDGKLVDSEKLDPLLQEAEEIAKMLASSLLTLKGKR